MWFSLWMRLASTLVMNNCMKTRLLPKVVVGGQLSISFIYFQNFPPRFVVKLRRNLLRN